MPDAPSQHAFPTAAVSVCVSLAAGLAAGVAALVVPAVGGGGFLAKLVVLDLPKPFFIHCLDTS